MGWNALGSGWENDGDSGLWKANFSQKQSRNASLDLETTNYSNNVTMVAVVNPSNGAYDVYQADIFGRRTPVYRFSPETGASTPLGDGTLYNRTYKGAAGKTQLNNLNKSIKQATLNNLRAHATDSIAQRTLAELRETTGYQSLSNVALKKPKPDPPPPPPPPPGGGPGGGGRGSGDAPTNTADADETSNITSTRENVAGLQIADSPKNRSKFRTDLRYPLTLDINQDFLSIEMVKYEPRGFGPGDGGNLSVNPARPKPGEPIGRVLLPIPGGIQDTNSVQYGGQNMSTLEAEAAFLSLSIIEGGGAGLQQAANNILGRMKGNTQGLKDAFAAYFAGQAAGIGQQVIQRAAGAIFNPNMELLFQNPQLRPFNFSFKLSARSSPEADMIIQIIRMFKQGMAVQRTPSNLFLKAPHTFRLKYMQGSGKEHPFLNKFKECALQSFQVQYAPEGTYATFSDGKMVSYQIAMQFQELEPVFNDDYGNSEGDQIDTNIGF